MRIYDTQSQAKKEFQPVESGKIRMYVCGPTVYNYIHIGNARTFVSFDNIRRYLMWKGFEVTFVQNITDIDDKIIAQALEEGVSVDEVSKRYAQAFIDDMRAARVLDPTVRPRATHDVPAMIQLIKKLIEKGHAYHSHGDVYFDVRSFPSYGALSHRNIDELEQGHRDLRNGEQALVERKRDPLDFALWKAAKVGEPAWESPWGAGRPGWHIECSCMSYTYAGLPLDIHGGGADLAFPHHENERAQSEAGYGGSFANYWMHGGMLRLNNEKMSKSLGNFVLLRDVLKDVDVNVVRMLMAQTHYRSVLDFSDERLDEAQSALERIQNALNMLAFAKGAAINAQPNQDNFEYTSFNFEDACNKTRAAFETAMDDDFNTPLALGGIFTFISDINAAMNVRALHPSQITSVEQSIALIQELLEVFGIEISPEITERDEITLSKAQTMALRKVALQLGDTSDAPFALESMDASQLISYLLDVRTEARRTKDWDTADALRNAFQGVGLRIEDTPQGVKVVKA
ncbi:MAG: cysteine--tRNA ligase [Eggerthellaceae bacterium]|nr:cysteine--tRNA ligase [Eggerthellaceae bacterium]